MVRETTGRLEQRSAAGADRGAVDQASRVSREFLTHSPDETLALAKAIGEAISSPVVIGLIGPLGAGKTLFARGLAAGLGVNGRVTSPSFTLVHTYRGRMTVHHLDVYRLDDPTDLEGLGFDEMLDDAVVIVEWADRVERLLPRERLDVVIERVDGVDATNTRRIRMVARDDVHGALTQGVVKGGDQR